MMNRETMRRRLGYLFKNQSFDPFWATLRADGTELLLGTVDAVETVKLSVHKVTLSVMRDRIRNKTLRGCVIDVTKKRYFVRVGDFEFYSDDDDFYSGNAYVHRGLAVINEVAIQHERQSRKS